MPSSSSLSFGHLAQYQPLLWWLGRAVTLISQWQSAHFIHQNAAHSAAVWVINTLILPFKTLNNRRHDFSACWHSNPRERPLFPAILEQLERIRQSEFTRAPHESFHTMQDGWRLEIEEVLRDLRRKEKVWIVEKFISSYW